MTAGRFAILDPAAGISGDMLLGALIDAGAAPEWLEALPARLGFSDARVEISRVVRCGIMSTKVTVHSPHGEVEHPNPVWTEPHSHAPGTQHHSHHSHAPHHHVGNLIATLEKAPLSEWVRERAIRAFKLLAEQEGRIHGVAAMDVALHEVGAVDAMVDIVGGIEGFERLGIHRVYNRPVALGEGWIRAAHGILPVPAPVTARLLEGIEIAPNGPVTGEATTPTGAVLLRVLSAGRPPSRWRAAASGWGAGGRDPEIYPNALRLIIGEPAGEAGEVVTLSTDLDDLSPEYLEPLREALTSAGALDVQVWPTHMKKGRPGFRLEAITEPSAAERVMEALFLHSTTAGVRRSTMERVTLPRHQVEIEIAPGVSVRVKILEAPSGLRAKPEFDDVSAAARRLGRPALEISREVQTRALGKVAAVAPDTSRTLKEES
ncbi:MAG TPA: nickel pincer cofactor biosynthesis protein LarC [Gemmatimonadales bacterium]|nr:nickel pincer cofactor biosynthesis protein LarC [Gemmatimonadales bacterium]